MDQPLPPRAEAWLAALAHELWPLASDERAAVLAELRGHLIERAAAGSIEETLTALGTPAALAAAYDVPGRPGRGLAPFPEGFSSGGKKSLGALLSDMRATLRASRNGLPLVGALLFTVLTATSFLLWMDARMPQVGVETAPLMLVRLGAVLMAFSAAYRLALSPTERTWAVDRGFLAFCVAFVLGSLVSVGVALAVGRGAGWLAHSENVRRFAGLGMLAGMSCALLRVQPWLAALGARRGGFGLRDCWRGTRGRMATIVGAWAALILPLYLLHTLLNVLALRVLPFGSGSLALAAIDALLSTAIVLGAVMLNGAAYRWIVGEPIPAPSPFATGAGEPELVEAARARLDRLMRAQPVRAA
jgi:hypothetical protein